MKKKSENKSAPTLSNQIPRNVNYYSHFLAEPHITEKDIEWVLQLRDLSHNDLKTKLANIPNQAFSVADKPLESRKLKQFPRDISYSGNSTQILHLIRHRIGPTATLGQVDFETGLRSYGSKDKILADKERQWTTVPKLQRKQEFPEFLHERKTELELRKSSSANKLGKITYSAFDPDISLPNYVMKFKEKNIQNVRHLFVPNTKMSTIQWEDGLRELKPVKHKLAEKVKQKVQKHPNYIPYPLRRPGPAPDDRKTDIPLDIKIKQFNFASKTLKGAVEWEDIKGVSTSDSLNKGVIFVETEKGGVVVKGYDEIASGYYFSQLALILGLPVPNKRIVKWDEYEFKYLTKEIQRATFIHRELHEKVIKRLDRPFLEIQEYIPGISLNCMGRMRGAKIMNFYDPTSRNRLIKLGFVMSFDIFVNNPTRYPLETWVHPIQDLEHMIVRTDPRYTDTTRELRDTENLSFEYEYIYALDTYMFERASGYYTNVEEYLNKLFMEMRSIMLAQLDPLYETKEQKIESLDELKRLVYDHTLYEMKEMSLLQVMLGMVLNINNIVTLGPYRLKEVFESVEQDEDWNDIWQKSLNHIDIGFLETMISIFRKFCDIYKDVVKYSQEITLNQYNFDEERYFEIIMQNPKIRERILQQREKDKQNLENNIMNDQESEKNKDDSEILEKELEDEELDQKIADMFFDDQNPAPQKKQSRKQTPLSQSQGSLNDEPQEPKRWGGLLASKLHQQNKSQF